MACTTCGRRMGLARSGDGERICRAHSRQMCQRRAGRRSASGQCLKHHIQLLTCTCKRVLPRESMCTAGEARTHGACVTSVLCTHVLVCKAQSSERGRGSGEAEAWARGRCATCLLALLIHFDDTTVQLFTAPCRTRCEHICTQTKASRHRGMQ